MKKVFGILLYLFMFIGNLFAQTDSLVREELYRQNIQHVPIVLAQAKLESANYTSHVSKSYHNLFGLKKGRKYRKYNTWEESVAAYKQLIQSRYKGGDYYQFLKRIRYAEDPNYIRKLKRIVKNVEKN